MSLKFFLIFLILLPKISLAHCPACVAATGAAVATAKFYGIPDLISGVFIGAFIASIAAWTSNVFSKNIYFRFQKHLILFLVIILFLFPFYFAGLISFYDKIFIGILVGIFTTFFAFLFNDFLKKSNKIYLPFQGILLTFSFLLLAILACWFGGFL